MDTGHVRRGLARVPESNVRKQHTGFATRRAGSGVHRRRGCLTVRGAESNVRKQRTSFTARPAESTVRKQLPCTRSKDMIRLGQLRTTFANSTTSSHLAAVSQAMPV
ncbi:unnamed protein product [Arctogadus glacialis]